MPHSEDDRGVILVTAALVQPMLKLFHDSHPGIAAAQQLMARELWWPRMTQDIVRYCKTCHICDSFKPSRASQKTPMGMFEESPLPAEEVCVDVLGATAGEFLWTQIFAGDCRPLLAVDSRGANEGSDEQ